MHDQLDQQRMSEDSALAAALRTLPAAEPPGGGWQRLSTRLRHRRRKRFAFGVALPAALAAGLAVAVWLPHLRTAPASVPKMVQQTSPAMNEADLATLRAHSQQLQAWVHALDRGGAPLNGDALASAVSLQDRIGLVDLQLTAARDPVTRATLWQQRITLLQRLGLLHLQPYTVAEHVSTVTNETTIL
jgi:hypothetical protein